MAIGIAPTVDYAFKRVFGDPRHSRVLVHLLNALFEQQFVVGEVQILNPFLQEEFIDGKFAILDLLVQDSSGRKYNLEMQASRSTTLAQRLIYYAARLYCSQLSKADEYSNLAPAICVGFLDFNYLRSITDFHSRFRLSSLSKQLEFSDRLELHLVELPKFRGKADDLPAAGRLAKWVYFLRHAAELEMADIERVFQEPEFVEAGGILEMISQTPEERILYEMRWKAMLDQRSFLSEARTEGREEGREEGRQEGREEGRQEGRQEGREQGQWIGRIQTLQEIRGELVASTDELAAMSLEQLASLAQSLQRRPNSSSS